MGLTIGAQTALLMHSLSGNPCLLQDDTAEDEEMGGRVEGWKIGRVEGWKSGRVEEWKGGRVEGWKDGRSEGWRVEGWKIGRMEGWKSGRVEEWKDGRLVFARRLLPETEYTIITEELKKFPAGK